MRSLFLGGGYKLLGKGKCGSKHGSTSLAFGNLNIDTAACKLKCDITEGCEAVEMDTNNNCRGYKSKDIKLLPVKKGDDVRCWQKLPGTYYIDSVNIDKILIERLY